MTQFLLLKEHIRNIYQKYSSLFHLLFRFIMGFLTFLSINRVVGYQPLLNHVYVEILLGLVTMIMPVEIMVFLAAMYVVVHVFYVSRILSLAIAVIFLILYLLYVQFVPRHGYIILAVPIAFALGIPYGIPVLLGLVFSTVSIIPMSIGIGIYYLLRTLTSVVASASDDTINLFQVLMNQMVENQEMYVTICIFAVVLVVVYGIRNLRQDYSFEIAVFVGMILNTILLLIENYLLAINLNILYFILGTLLSGVLVWLIQMFRITINYASVENLQFEDEEYYYYVRAVPKMSVATQNKRVKRFNAHLFERGEGEQDSKQDLK